MGFKSKAGDIFTRLLRKMPVPLNRLPEEHNYAEFRRLITDRFITSDSGINQKTKAFGIGLSKTGTTSLAEALRILGYRTGHWRLPELNNKVIDWREFAYLDAATDTICAAEFESLYYTYPQSKFIYTTRDLEAWNRSITSFFGMNSPQELISRYQSIKFWDRGPGWGWHNAFRTILLHQALYMEHDSWKDAYMAFDDRVRHFFSNKPEHRFIEMSVTGGDGWEVLCPFLDSETPDQSFPHLNKASTS